MVWNLTFYKLSRSNFIVGDYVCEENIHNLSLKKNWWPWYMKHICQLFILMRVWKVTHIFKMTNWERAYISSVQFSCSVVSDSLWHHESQHPRPPCPSPTPRVHLNPRPLSQWWHPTISSSVSTSPPAVNLTQHQGLFKWVSSSHQVAKVLEFQLQHQSFQWTLRTDLL